MIPHLRRQIPAVMRLELRKTFFAKRGLWVYLLAVLPVLLYLATAVYAGRERVRLERIAREHPVTTEALNVFSTETAFGVSRDDVIAQLGQPYATRSFQFGFRQEQRTEQHIDRYTDGKQDVTIIYSNGLLQNVRRRPAAANLEQFKIAFAGVFDLYFLRLAIFFGCVGIFMNLFRGELLDKSLHFYLLTPVPRAALLAGKYATGLIATTAIFTVSAALQWAAMLWQFDSTTVQAYLAADGWNHFAWYLAVTALACVGYGSVFLTAGLVFRNPIVPAVVVLIWESIMTFVPATLKQFSMIYYLQSLSPIQPPPDPNMPPLLALLVSVLEPAGTVHAVGAILAIAAVMLVAAGLKARKLEINYSAD